MDIRATDRTHIASKGIEVERSKPVKGKQAFMHDAFATRTAAEANGNVNRPRPPKAMQHGEKKENPQGSSEDAAGCKDVGKTETDQVFSDAHVLDVKV